MRKREYRGDQGTESLATVPKSSRPPSSPLSLTPPRPYIRSISPADQIVIAYLTIVSALVLVLGGQLRVSLFLVLAHAVVIAVITVIARWRPRPSSQAAFPVEEQTAEDSPRISARFGRASSFKVLSARLLHGWYPLGLVPLTYKELEYLIPRLHPGDLDWQLAAIDHRIFGVHPTVWLERVTYPLITELFQLSYICYYFLPLALGISLWRKRQFERYHFVLFVIVLGFYLSYLGYMAVPAVGPRFILKAEQTLPLTGVLVFQAIRSTLDWAEGITRDCFPSGHTAVTLLVLYYARKFHRRAFWLMLPAGSALIFSTVYLRYHYVIDVLAGGLLAVAVLLIAKPLYRALGGGEVF